MSFSNDWSVSNNPADHSKFKDQPSFVRKVRQDLEDRLAALINGFTSGETAEGFKKFLGLNQASDPSTPTDAAVMYAKDSDESKSEFHVKHEDGQVARLTSNGAPILAMVLTNKSGGSVAAGDVVILDTGNDSAFTTTTTEKLTTNPVYVVQATIADNAVGVVTSRGRVKIKVTGTVTRGDYLITSTSAGSAKSNGTTYEAGVFAIALSADSGGYAIAELLGISISIPVSTTITGEIRMWGSTIASIPSGWLHCDGSAISRSTYAALFAVIGTQYGSGDGSTTFNLPDTRNFFPVGANADNGGSAKSTANDPAISAKTRSNNNRSYKSLTGQYGSGAINSVQTYTNINQVDLANNTPTEHPTYPNYIAFAFMIKT